MMIRILIPVLLLSACLPVPPGRFECAVDTDCPSDWVCVAERCYDEAPPIDAGVDATQDARMLDVPADTREEDADMDAMPSDVGIDAVDATPPDVPALPPRPVDVLFVIDNSGTMEEEQARLRAAMPELITGLALGSSVAGETFPPIRDMHVGVVTTHMDVGEFGSAVPTCRACDQELGYDGQLTEQARERVAGDDCTAIVPECADFDERFLSYDGTGASLTQLQAGAACKARVTNRGCGFEQPLEAALKALSPNSSMLFRGTGGHSDGVNAGFLREDSVLVVVFITDEEDCSSPNDEMFNLESAVYPRERLNVRCADNPDQLYAPTRYAQGLLRVHPANQLVVASLVGVPTDIAGEAPGDILRDPDMEYMAETMPGSSNVVPAAVCSSAASRAGAARRFFEVAEDLRSEGAGTENESICAETYTPFFGRVLESVRERVLR